MEDFRGTKHFLSGQAVKYLAFLDNMGFEPLLNSAIRGRDKGVKVGNDTETVRMAVLSRILPTKVGGNLVPWLLLTYSLKRNGYISADTRMSALVDRHFTDAY